MTIPYGRQDVTEADVAAVVEVLRSDWLTQGPAIPRFERTVAAYCGVPHAVAVCNATAALHIACRALGLGPGDRLWTTPITFVASANCALYCGAQVDFVDVEERSGNMDIDALRFRLEQAEQRGVLPKIVIPVHFAGQSCDMRAIGELSRRFGFRIIEDASHAIGGRYDGLPVGTCLYSDITVFSFHPVKIVTTAEGGMALTRDVDLAARMQLLRSHGITREAARMQGVPEGGWYYEQLELGYNYRMTDLQAALGDSQMNRLDAYVARRNALAEEYDRALAQLPLALPWRDVRNRSALHLYPVRVGADEANDSDRAQLRHRVFDALRDAGIGVNVHYIPVHLQPYYRALGFKVGDFPVAERFYSGAISLPMFATLSDEAQARVVAALEKTLT